MPLNCSYRAFLPLLIGLFLISCSSDADSPPQSGDSDSAAIHLVDAIGDTVILAHPAQRVLSLAPNLTEMMFALDAGNKLVGRTDFCNYPPEAASIPSIGNYQSLNYEQLLSLQPDLILMTYAGNTKASYEKLKELGMRPYAVEAETVDGVIRTLDTIGMLIGAPQTGARVAATIRSTVDSIRERAATAPPVSAFIAINREPLMTVSRGFIDEALTIAGGQNIVSGGVAAYPTYNREELIRRDPEVIIIPTAAYEDINEFVRTYPEWRQLQAVKSHRVYTLPADIILRPGPRVAASVILLYEALHGADPKALFERALTWNR